MTLLFDDVSVDDVLVDDVLVDDVFVADGVGASMTVQAAVDVFCLLSSPQRDSAYMDVEREIRRLKAVQAAMINEVHVSGSFQFDGHRSVTNWVQAVTNQTHGTALGDVRVAAMLRSCPVFAAALAAGELGADQIRLLARLWANPRVRALLPDWSQELLGHALRLDAQGFRVACQRWLAHADPDGAHHDHEMSRENRRVTTATIGFGQITTIEGDALTGEIMNEIRQAHAHAEFLDDVAERAARYGDQAEQYPLRRTAAQRMYDAMVAIHNKAAGITSSLRREPLVNIVVSQSDCEDAIRTVLGTGVDLGDIGDISDIATASGTTSRRMRFCQTVSGAYVDPFDLVAALLIGSVRRVVVDSLGRVLDLGRRRRLFRGAVREAVLLLDNRCTKPGCGLHMADIQIDHLAEWFRTRDGTNPFNGGPACGHDNRVKHSLGHTVVLDENGWHHYRADGTEIAPRTRVRPRVRVSLP